MAIRIVGGDHASLPMQHRQQCVADATVVEGSAEAGQSLRHDSASRPQGPAQSGEALAQCCVTQAKQVADLTPCLPGKRQGGDGLEGRRQPCQQDRHVDQWRGARGDVGFGKPASLATLPAGSSASCHARLVADHAHQPGAVFGSAEIQSVLSHGNEQGFLQEVVGVRRPSTEACQAP